MKFALLFLACVGVSLAAPKPSSLKIDAVHYKVSLKESAQSIGQKSLLEDLLGLVAILPLEDLLATLDEHVASDAAVAAVIEYLQSDRWNNLVDEVLAKPAAVDFIEYLNGAGIPVDLIIGAIRAVIDGAQPGVEADQDGSLRPFLDEIEGEIPIDDVVAYVNDRLQNSPDLQDLYTVIASEDGKALVDEVLQMDEAVYIQDELTGMGVDVAGVLEAVYTFFGWGAPPAAAKISHKSLLEDLLGLVAILPLDDLLATLDEHVASDAAVAAVIEYLQSDRWNNLVDEVLAKPAAVDFIAYLNDAGIPVDLIIGAIRAIIDGAQPGVEADQDGSLRPFLDEIEGELPVDDIIAYVNDRLQNSPDLQDLYTTIASEDGKALVDEVLQMEEAVYIQDELTGMGVDVAGVLNAVYEFFGWGAPPAAAKISHKSLLEDLLGLVAILPLDDLLATLDEHVASDAAVAAVIEYLQSDRWNNLVDEVLAKPAAVDFIAYLNDAGIPVDLIIGAIRAIIDGAQPGVEADQDGSLRPFLDEIEGELPVDDIIAYVNDRLQNSPDLQDLYTTIASEDGKALVDEVLQMEEAVYIQDELTGMGVDVAGVLNAVYEFFGWGAPPAAVKISHKSLLEDLLGLVAILPLDDLLATLDEHVASDAAVAAVIEYLQSDRWNNLVDEVLAKPAAVDFIAYLNDAGIPVDLIIGAIRAIIDGAQPGVEADQDGSLRPFLDEIEGELPVDDIIAYVNDRLQNSPDLQDLYTTIASEDGKALVDEVLQMDKAVYIQDELTGMGVDVAGVLNAVYEFFGWGAPPAAAKISHKSLLEDLLGLVAILPLDDLLATLDEHVASDAAVAAVIEYLQSDRWNNLVDEVLAKPAAVDFIAYLNDAGIPVDLIIGAIRAIIDGAQPGVEADQDGSLRPFLDEIEGELPVDDIIAYVNDRLQNSPDLQDLYTTIASEDGKALVDEVLQMEEAVYIQDELTGMGVDVAGVLNAVYEFFGWGAPPAAAKISHKSLLEDLLGLVAILPLDDLLATLDEHVASDAALAAVIEYLQSDRWNNLVDEVLAKPAAVDFIAYLNDAGIPVDLIIGAIRAIIDGAQPGVAADQDGSLRPFLDEIEGELPVDDIIAYVNDRLQNSPDLQDLYTTIASEDGKALVDEVLQMDEAVYIQDELTGMGVDVAGVLNAVYEFFGWGAPPAAAKISHKSLLEDLLGLVAILPLEDLLATLDEHVASDAALAAVIEYLQSDRWNNLVDEVLAKPAAVDFIAYLNDAGIPVDLIIGAIRAIIDGAQPGVAADQDGSLRPFLDEIEGELPVDDIIAYVNDRLQNSPDLQDLYTTIASEDGKALVDEVLQMDEAVYIQDELTGMGVDVAGVLNAVYEFFGWGAPPQKA